MSKISDMQKNGMSFMPDMADMAQPQIQGGDDMELEMAHVIPTTYYYDSELVQYDMNALNFFTRNDVEAESMLDMIGMDLPEFHLTEQSLDSSLIFYKNICRMSPEDIPQISLTYEGQDNQYTRYFFSISVTNKTNSGALCRIRQESSCIEFFRTDAMEWTEDPQMEQVLDIIRNDECRGRFILDSRKLMNVSILMTSPDNILNDLKRNEPLLRLAEKLEGYASFHILFDYAKMNTKSAQTMVLEASDPKLKGAGVAYRNGTYELMQLYLPNEEHDGLILYDPEAEENEEHIMRTIYRTKDMEELVPLLYNMWSIPNKGEDWFIAPLSTGACLMIAFGMYPEECVKVGRTDGETTEEETAEIKKLEILLGVCPANPWN